MNYLQTLNYGSSKLKLNNIETHVLDSEILLSFILNSSREKILINQNTKIAKNIFYKYKKLLLRRQGFVLLFLLYPHNNNLNFNIQTL